MSVKEIAYDIILEDKLEKIKSQIWLNEELQIQPKSLRESIFEIFMKLHE